MKMTLVIQMGASQEQLLRNEPMAEVPVNFSQF